MTKEVMLSLKFDFLLPTKLKLQVALALVNWMLTVLFLLERQSMMNKFWLVRSFLQRTKTKQIENKWNIKMHHYNLEELKRDLLIWYSSLQINKVINLRKLEQDRLEFLKLEINLPLDTDKKELVEWHTDNKIYHLIWKVWCLIWLSTHIVSHLEWQ